MPEFYRDDHVTLLHGHALDVLKTLPDGSVNCCVTSPPYFGLRDYGEPGQYGLEKSPAEYVENMRALFAEVRRVLADDGVLWLNIGSSYAANGPSGPQGKTGQRADRAFTAAGLGASVARRDARKSGTPCTERSGCPDSGCACSDLCDGCAIARSSRTSDNTQQRLAASQHPSRTIRDTSLRDSPLASPVASALDAQESTNLRSSELPPEICSHCRNCGACLAVLGSYARDARLCARKAGYKFGTSQRESDDRNQGTGDEGTAWFKYSQSLTPKNLIPIPWMVAMALQMDGWVLRNSIIWSKPNAMPESVTDRLSTRHELIFLFSKKRSYWFDLDPIREERARGERFDAVQTVERKGNRTTGIDGQDRKRNGSNPSSVWNTGIYKSEGRNPGDVWEIATQPFPGAHFAVFPVEIPRRCIAAGCAPKVCRECGHKPPMLTKRRDARLDCGHNAYDAGTVLDPFSGSGTTGLAAGQLGRKYIGIDLSRKYLELSLQTRLAQTALIDGGAA